MTAVDDFLQLSRETLQAANPGVFMPDLKFGGSNTGITYAGNRSGNYLMLASVCLFSFVFSLTNKGAQAGAATIDFVGMPVVMNALGAPNIPLEYQNVVLNTAGGFTNMTGTVNFGTATLQLRQQGNNVAFVNMANTDFANNSLVRGTGHFFISTPAFP